MTTGTPLHPPSRQRAGSAIVALAAAGLLACGTSDVVPVVDEGPGDDVGYVDGTDVVVVDDVTYVVTGGPTDDCVRIGDECIDLAGEKAKHCGDPDAQADIVVVDGQVVDVICYPPRSSGISVHDVERTADGTAEVPQNANNTVVIFDERTDGVPIEGNLHLVGENIALIGNGVDNTIIDGNIKVESNNARIRGLTVSGNLTLERTSNNASVTFCKVLGNLEVHANSVSVISCQVFGNVDVKGNNAILVKVGVGGSFKVVNADVCDGNYAFDDDDGDFVVSPDEVGLPLSCAP